jgi:hypothetical protein
MESVGRREGASVPFLRDIVGCGKDDCLGTLAKLKTKKQGGIKTAGDDEK